MESLSLEETQPRQEPYVVPGWDTEENDSDVNESELYDEINDDQYATSLKPTVPCFDANGLNLQLIIIQPIPSQILDTLFQGKPLPITLDSGATVSFIREDWAIHLKLPTSPNRQIATLADKKTSIEEVGEVD